MREAIRGRDDMREAIIIGWRGEAIRGRGDMRGGYQRGRGDMREAI